MDEAVVLTGPVASYSWLGDLGVVDSGTLQGESAIVPGFALLSLTRATQEALKLRCLMPRPRRFRSEQLTSSARVSLGGWKPSAPAAAGTAATAAIAIPAAAEANKQV